MTVKVYHSDQTGAPTLNGIVGSLVNLMDAVLVNGFNQVSVSSITRTGSLVTVQTVGPHGYDNPGVKWWNKNGVGNIATIAGADQPDYNGEWPVTYVDEQTFTFDIGTATPASPATGTILTKRAPAGFAKAFADVNRAAYRSNDITSRRHFLAVNDIADCPNSQGARYASWRGFESMTGIDNWEFPFPTIINAHWGEYFCKSNGLDSGRRAWTVISDGKFILFLVVPDSGDFSNLTWSRLYGFGDILATAPDPYATLIACNTSSSSSYSVYLREGLMSNSNTNATEGLRGTGWTCLARRYNGQASPVWAAGLYGHSFITNSLECFGARQYASYPNPFDNNLYLSPIKVTEGGIIRGTLPIYDSLHGNQHGPREIITNVKGLEGRSLMYLRCGAGYGGELGGVYVDITGPWS